MCQSISHRRNARAFHEHEKSVKKSHWTFINTVYMSWRLIGRRDRRGKMALRRAYLPTVRFVLDFFSTRRQCALLTR